MIISLYAGGMTVRGIQHHLEKTIGTDLGPETISNITDAVSDAVLEWRERPLDEFYPVVCLDAVRVKVRDNGGAAQGGAHRHRRRHGRVQACAWHMGPGQRGRLLLGARVRRDGQLWLAICDIEDKRSLKRAKDGNKTRRKSEGRLIEGRITTNWKQALAQLAAVYSERMEPYL